VRAPPLFFFWGEADDPLRRAAQDLGEHEGEEELSTLEVVQRRKARVDRLLGLYQVRQPSENQTLTTLRPCVVEPYRHYTTALGFVLCEPRRERGEPELCFFFLSRGRFAEAQKQHWRLLERARIKHRKYYLRRGRSAAKPVKAPGDTTTAADDGGVACALDVCDAPKCTGLVMPLAKFCVRHILLQPGQCLYVPDSACANPL